MYIVLIMKREGLQPFENQPCRRTDHLCDVDMHIYAYVCVSIYACTYANTNMHAHTHERVYTRFPRLDDTFVVTYFVGISSVRDNRACRI